MLDNKGHACLGSCTKQISLLTESESRGYIYDMKILRLAILRLGSLAKKAMLVFLRKAVMSISGHWLDVGGLWDRGTGVGEEGY